VSEILRDLDINIPFIEREGVKIVFRKLGEFVQIYISYYFVFALLLLDVHFLQIYNGHGNHSKFFLPRVHQLHTFPVAKLSSNKIYENNTIVWLIHQCDIL